MGASYHNNVGKLFENRIPSIIPLLAVGIQFLGERYLILEEQLASTEGGE